MMSPAHSTSANPSAPADRCRTALLVIGVVVVLATTLFPYAVVPGDWAATASARFSVRLAGHAPDLAANVLLFVPLGLGIVAQGRSLPGVLVGIVAGTLLSGAVEAVQVLQPTRSPALSDLLANALGVGLGVAAGPGAARGLCRALAAVGRGVTPRVAAVLAVVYGVGLWAWHGQAVRLAGLDGWDVGYGLRVGNETTADRPWRGRLTGLRLWDQAVAPADSAAAAPFADYPLSGPGDLADRTGRLPALAWRGPTGPIVMPAQSERGAVRISPQRWLTLTTGQEVLNAAIRRRGAFTVSLRCATADTSQDGPARIFTVSQGPYRRNFTIGQEGRDLVVRLRTPFTGANGSDPALVVPEVFVDTGWRKVTVAYDGSTLRAWTGVGDPARLGIARAALFCRGSVRFAATHQGGYDVVWWVLVAGVPAAAVAEFVSGRRRRRKTL